MNESKRLVAHAGRILREYSAHSEGTAALAVAASAFVSLARREPADKSESVDDRIARIMREAADLICPVCPHCGQELIQPESEESANGV
jgi:hypothetical protein